MSTPTFPIKVSEQNNQFHGLRSQVLFQLVVIGLLMLFLLNYKGTAGIAKIRRVRASGTLNLPVLLQASDPLGMSAIHDTAAYLKIVWPALLLGVLISAAVRTSILRTPLHSFFGRGAVRDQVTGALAGMSLMLCSCCAAPIFPAIYERTRRAGPAMAVALAAPSLNPVALTLSFALFPWRIAGARLAMALTLVLIGSAVAASITRPVELPINLARAKPFTNWREMFYSYFQSLHYISLRTVPLIMVGICASMWIMRKVPLTTLGVSAGTHVLGIAIITLVAVLLTLPSLFEIPLALTILAAGGPTGAAAAVLFAGPAINLPSLLVIGRNSSWKVGVTLAGLVWAIAATGGLLLR